MSLGLTLVTERASTQFPLVPPSPCSLSDEAPGPAPPSLPAGQVEAEERRSGQKVSTSHTGWEACELSYACSCMRSFTQASVRELLSQQPCAGVTVRCRGEMLSCC